MHGFPQIIAAEQYVIKHHLGDVISQSFSATEQTFPNAGGRPAPARRLPARPPRTTSPCCAASGDSGAADLGLDQTTYYMFPVTSWPDSDPLVTGVGGTQLHFTAQGTPTAPDRVERHVQPGRERVRRRQRGPNPLASGGGMSIFFARPALPGRRADMVGASRGVPDVSMSAACNGVGGHLRHYGGAPALVPACGTSEATPLFAGIVALADQVAGHPSG